MAITRLTDIVSVFESKWTYGDVKFGYEGDVNQDHDTKYPLMLIQPPESIIPTIYDGREEYTFEINFYNLYSQAAQSVVELQQRWDNLQDLANEWLDFVLKNYQDVTVEVYLNDESIEIERVKDVANDKLVQLKLTFTMSGFAKCFRPQSNYPSDFSDLVVWLKADSGVDFEIATKKVSLWTDQSTSVLDDRANVDNSNTDTQPLREGYDGANDKTYISFDGTDDILTSTINCPISTNSYTIFVVSKQNVASADPYPIFSYLRGGKEILVGFKDNKFYSYVNDGSASLELNSVDSSSYGLISTSLDAAAGTLKTSINGGITSSSTTGWDEDVTWDDATFTIGGSTGRFANANVEEIIIYNRVLTDNEKADIKGYINYKYKIY